jgi:hypothetical protein
MTRCWAGSRVELPRQEQSEIRAFLIERFERFRWFRYLPGPSTALRYAQDDGGVGWLEIDKAAAGVMVVGWTKRVM